MAWDGPQAGSRLLEANKDGTIDERIGDFNALLSPVYRPSTGLAYIRNSHTTGVADIDFVYGISSDHIIAGDWDSDGDDSVGIYRPSDHTFRLSFDNQQGMPDMAINWGNGQWIPVAVSDPQP